MSQSRVDLIANNAKLLDPDDQAETAGMLLESAGINASTFEAFARCLSAKTRRELTRLLAADNPPAVNTEAPNVQAQIAELKLFRDGWLDGEGIALSVSGLDWLAKAFAEHFPEPLPQPYLFPTPEGEVCAEWLLGRWDISLEINLATKDGIWHGLHLDDDYSQETVLNLHDIDGWRWLCRVTKEKKDGQDEHSLDP